MAAGGAADTGLAPNTFEDALAVPADRGGRPSKLALPNIETRSSSGLLDVPASKFAAAGVDANTVVAARPDGFCWPASGLSSTSSKSSRFSARLPAATVSRALAVEMCSSASLHNR